MSKNFDDGIDWSVSLLRFCSAMEDAGLIDSYVLSSIDDKPRIAWIRKDDKYLEWDISLQKVIDSTDND